MRPAVDLRAFSERVMRLVALEPRPSPARSLRTAVQHRRLDEAWGAIASAWHLATMRGAIVRGGVRVRSVALLLAVSLMLALGTSLAAAGVSAVVRLAAEHRTSTRHDAPLDLEFPTPAELERASPSASPSAAPPSPAEPLRVVGDSQGGATADELRTGQSEGDVNDAESSVDSSPSDDDGEDGATSSENEDDDRDEADDADDGDAADEDGEDD